MDTSARFGPLEMQSQKKDKKERERSQGNVIVSSDESERREIEGANQANGFRSPSFGTKVIGMKGREREILGNAIPRKSFDDDGQPFLSCNRLENYTVYEIHTRKIFEKKS